jgi:hypothetical protein
VVLLAVATGCGGGGDLGSAAPPPTTSLAATSTSPATSGPELDAETARNRGLGSIGPDLATVAALDGVSGQPVTPYDLTATDSDSPCPSLRFSADGLPDGLLVTAAGDCTARVSGTLRAAAGRYVVTYRVTDDTGASDVSVATFDVRG